MATNGVDAGDLLQQRIHTKLLKSYIGAVRLEMGDIVHVSYSALHGLYSMALVGISLH